MPPIHTKHITEYSKNIQQTHNIIPKSTTQDSYRITINKIAALYHLKRGCNILKYIPKSLIYNRRTLRYNGNHV